MLIPEFVQDIKNEISKKMKLQDRRVKIISSIKNGEAYFLRDDLTKEDEAKGVQQVLRYLNELDEIDNSINDIDVIIAVKLESFLGDSVIKATAPERTNDAGDIIERNDVALTPFKSSDASYIELVPDDIWFLKIVKKALAVKNVEIISKDKYYKK